MLEAQNDVSAFGDLNLHGVDCQTGFNFFEKYIMMMVMPFFVFGVIALVLALYQVIVKIRIYIYTMRNTDGVEEAPDNANKEVRRKELTEDDKDKSVRGLAKLKKIVSTFITERRANRQRLQDIMMNARELKKQAESKYRRMFLLYVIVVMFLLYPTLIQQCSLVMNCEQLDFGDTEGMHTVLVPDRREECWTPRHTNYVFISGMFYIAYGLGIPLFVFISVRSVWRLHGRAAALETFGFMCGEYTPSDWYWELIIMLRKAIMVFISVFIVSARAQLYTSSYLIGVCLLLNLWRRPYASKILSNLEASSLTCNLVTVNASLLFFFTDVGSGLYWFLSTMLLTINCAVFAAFMYFIWSALKDKLRDIIRDDPKLLNIAPWLAPWLELNDLLEVKPSPRFDTLEETDDDMSWPYEADAEPSPLHSPNTLVETHLRDVQDHRKYQINKLHDRVCELSAMRELLISRMLGRQKRLLQAIERKHRFVEQLDVELHGNPVDPSGVVLQPNDSASANDVVLEEKNPRKKR